jgi:hypothetical protein
LDTYRGCSHGCSYCFARAKRDLADVRPGESVASLRRWIDGQRTLETNWCDWRIPLHFGALSDPLQPCERRQRRTLACLEFLAAQQYPFVLSTKSTLALESPWRDVLSECRVVMQVSMVGPRFDRLESGAPPFTARLTMLPDLARLVSRVIVRCQPYSPELLGDVLRALPCYAAAGVHGFTIEAMKWKRGPAGGRPSSPSFAFPPAGAVEVGADWCYPARVLEPHFLRIRDRCHDLRLRFYAAENRLRRLSDDPCCCGAEGLPSFVSNAANLNALVFGRPLRYRPAMRRPGTATAFKSVAQSPLSTGALKRLSYADCMGIVAAVPAYRAAMGLDPPTDHRRRMAIPARSSPTGAPKGLPIRHRPTRPRP